MGRSGDLGTLLADVRRGSPGVGVVLIAIGVALAAGCLWLSREEPAVLAGLIIPILIATVGVWGVRHRVQVHEAGVEVRDLIGERRIRFDEADTLIYRTVALSMGGVPTGTYVWAQLRSRGRKVTFNLRAEKGQAEALEEFRTRASEEIARAALESVRAGSPFQWGHAAILAAEALHYRPSGLLGRKGEQVAPYGGLRYGFDGGSFSVYPPDVDRALFTMKCDEPNFYPGLVLFASLRNTEGPRGPRRQ